MLDCDDSRVGSLGTASSVWYTLTIWNGACSHWQHIHSSPHQWHLHGEAVCVDILMHIPGVHGAVLYLLYYYNYYHTAWVHWYKYCSEAYNVLIDLCFTRRGDCLNRLHALVNFITGQIRLTEAMFRSEKTPLFVTDIISLVLTLRGSAYSWCSWRGKSLITVWRALSNRLLTDIPLTS